MMRTLQILQIELVHIIIPTGMIGDDLELLQKGTGYLGNKVLGSDLIKPGFDSSNFDNVAFDAIEIDEDGLEVPSGIDTKFRGTES